MHVGEFLNEIAVPDETTKNSQDVIDIEHWDRTQCDNRMPEEAHGEQTDETMARGRRLTYTSMSAVHN